jgi:uncharacterized membrane protein
MANQIIDSVIVEGDVAEIYKMWANFEEFPKFMKNIKSVKKTGADTSHWIMEGPMGKDLEWDARTTRMEENKRIAWNSFAGDLRTSGQVVFNSLANHETEVTLILEYVPPGGMAGEIAARIFGDPEKRVAEDLRNFKKHVEGRMASVARK